MELVGQVLAIHSTQLVLTVMMLAGIIAGSLYSSK
jgi:hypothetical protein